EFNNHFGKYGDITDSVISKDRMTGQPRGFGFITYVDHLVVDKVIQDTHVFSEKQVEVKSTIPRETDNSKGFKTKKIFVR
nr:heterogeneous nuclear ribonucleoprotein 1 [Tanacetum cinerariifolium]